MTAARDEAAGQVPATAGDLETTSQLGVPDACLNSTLAADPPSIVSDDPEATMENTRGGHGPAGAIVPAPRSGDGPGADLDQRLIGNRLGPVVLRKLLGAGGMGRVYMGWHEHLHRPCAVKVFATAWFGGDEGRTELFRSEARNAARLVHPHIVAVHSLGLQDDLHFIEMEYVEGRDLLEAIRRDGAFDARTATRLLYQIAGALAVAERHGIVHCDIKPGNVILAGRAEADGDPVAKLADFGLSRAFQPEGGRAVASGTPLYVAPELLDGKPASSASDRYSLGVTYYTLLTGRAPFRASSVPKLIAMRRGADFPDPRDVAPHLPRSVCGLVKAMTRRDPAERPGVADLLARVRGVADTLTDLRELVARAMQGLAVRWSVDGDAMTFDCDVPGRRTQQVHAEVHDHPVAADLAAEADEGERLVCFWSPCAPAHGDHYPYVLELNGRLPYGAIAVREYRGRPYFVMVHNQPRATLDAAEIRSAVMSLAQHADVVEEKLTGADVH